MQSVVPFDPNTFRGAMLCTTMIFGAFDIVVYEDGTDPNNGIFLNGPFEIGLFDANFNKPVYAFVSFD